MSLYITSIYYMYFSYILVYSMDLQLKFSQKLVLKEFDIFFIVI